MSGCEVKNSTQKLEKWQDNGGKDLGKACTRSNIRNPHKHFDRQQASCHSCNPTGNQRCINAQPIRKKEHAPIRNIINFKNI